MTKEPASPAEIADRAVDQGCDAASLLFFAAQRQINPGAHELDALLELVFAAVEAEVREDLRQRHGLPPDDIGALVEPVMLRVRTAFSERWLALANKPTEGNA